MTRLLVAAPVFVLAGALGALGALGACASTKDMMAGAVLDRAQHDLTCDTASIRTRMAGNITRTKSERQGTVERATFAAEGCGDSEVYTVECIRGVCFAVQDVPPRDAKKKQAPDFSAGSMGSGGSQQ